MAYKTPTELKGRFEGGDIPDETDFVNFIDSVHAQTRIVNDADNTGASNVTTTINGHIDAAKAAGGGTVLLPPGSFLAADIKMKSKVRLMGHGRSTQLILPAGATTPLISTFDTDVEHTVIQDLYLFGDRTNQTNTAATAIKYDNTGFTFQTSSTPRHLFRNLMIKDFYGNGVETVNAPGNNLAENVHCYQIRGEGFSWGANDSVLSNCWATSTLGHAFNLGGGNQKLVGCKAGFAGRLGAGDPTKVGFRFGGNRIQAVGCEAQNGAHHGFLLIDANMIDLVGCHADANGQDAVSAGFKLDNVDESNLVGCKAGDLQEGGNPIEQDYALEMTNNPTRCKIQIVVKEYKTGVHTGTFGTNNLIEIISDDELGYYGVFRSNVLMNLFRDVSTNTQFQSSVPGDANPRYQVQTAGRMSWGDGTAALDTNLYRLSANNLRTDDKLLALGGLGVGNDVLATTPGTVTRKIEIFNENGNSLGFLVVYDAIT